MTGTVAYLPSARARAATMPAPPDRGRLPAARSLLAVVARPGQESVELGGLLHAYRCSGARLALLCLTRGEASPFNSSLERLETLRPWELKVAAGVLGVSSVAVADYPDGGLSGCPAKELTGLIRREIRRQAPEVLLVVDPAVGSPDDVAVAAAVRRAAQLDDLPALARCLPESPGGWLADLGSQAAAARAAQRSAAAAHASQSDVLPMVQHILGLLDGRERLRWLALAHPERRVPYAHAADTPADPRRDRRDRGAAVPSRWLVSADPGSVHAVVTVCRPVAAAGPDEPAG